MCSTGLHLLLKMIEPITISQLAAMNERGIVEGVTVVSPYGSTFTITAKGKLIDLDGDGSIMYYELDGISAHPAKAGYIYCAKGGYIYCATGGWAKPIEP